MKVWVCTGRTESGDDIGPHVFNKKPNAKQREAFLRETYQGEWEDDGPGDYGSWIFSSWDEVEVEEP